MSLPITFPAIAFHVGPTPKWPRIEAGYVDLLEVEDEITRLDNDDFKFGRFENMLLVDGSGKAFRLVNLVKDGYANSFLSRLWIGPIYKVRPELVEEAPMPFGELVDRVCASIEQSHDGWYNEEVAAGEAGPGTARSEDELIAELIARLRAAKTFDGLCDVLADPYDEYSEEA